MNITVRAPAKVNLLLDVTPEIIDGRHQLTSVFIECSLVDSLEFEFRESLELADGVPGRIAIATTFQNDISPVDIPLESNIIYRALLALAQQTNKPLPHTTVKVTKCIPVCGGLGGGSSDAAAAIRALALYWGLKPTAPECLAAAQAVGSDVTFFLYGGCALMGGHGQMFIRRLTRPSLEFALVKPQDGNSTAEVYRAFDELPSHLAQAPNPSAIHQLSMALDAACVRSDRFALEALAAQMSNNLTAAAIAVMPELDALLGELGARPGVVRAVLAGSGSTCFALCESKQAAEQVAAYFKQRGFWTAACSTPTHCSQV
jgi:4-diphosphocytidyl-2-C-methyl-D-erythritol kinase